MARKKARKHALQEKRSLPKAPNKQSLRNIRKFGENHR